MVCKQIKNKGKYHKAFRIKEGLNFINRFSKGIPLKRTAILRKMADTIIIGNLRNPHSKLFHFTWHFSPVAAAICTYLGLGVSGWFEVIGT